MDGADQLVFSQLIEREIDAMSKAPEPTFRPKKVRSPPVTGKIGRDDVLTGPLRDTLLGAPQLRTQALAAAQAASPAPASKPSTAAAAAVGSASPSQAMIAGQRTRSHFRTSNQMYGDQRLEPVDTLANERATVPGCDVTDYAKDFVKTFGYALGSRKAGGR